MVDLCGSGAEPKGSPVSKQAFYQVCFQATLLVFGFINAIENIHLLNFITLFRMCWHSRSYKIQHKMSKVFIIYLFKLF